MEKVDLVLSLVDADFDAFLSGLVPANSIATAHYNQEEDFFFRLPESFSVPSVSIHHPLENPNPSASYVATLRPLMRQLALTLPGIFSGLSWRFDPKDILRPAFIEIGEESGQTFLFILRLDLNFRGRYAQIVEQGNNDRIPQWRSKNLFCESRVFLLSGLSKSTSRVEIEFLRGFHQTWKGEIGRGISRSGVWIDLHITKFLSFALLGASKKMHPHYPLRCQYNTLTVPVIDARPSGRRRSARQLAAAWKFFSPSLATIEQTLAESPYSPDLPLFSRLSSLVPKNLREQFDSTGLESNFDVDGEREFTVVLH